jgi:hypothetical protein
VSRREQIRMSDDEVVAFLHEQRTVICASNGRDGWPHLMPLWYVVREADDDAPRLWSWTYAASQKTRNLERDARATLAVEAGEQYQELRGVMLKVDVAIHRELDVVAATGLAIFARYAGVGDGDGGPGELSQEVRAMVQAQAPKRVAFEFVERARASWDHRKLGGVY